MMILKLFILTIVSVNGQRLIRTVRRQSNQSVSSNNVSNNSHAELRKIRAPAELCTKAICNNCQRALSLQLFQQHEPEAQACFMLLTQKHCCHHSGRLYNGMLF